MDNVQRLIQSFRARPDASVMCKLDALMDIERLRDARVVSFLVDVLRDDQEPVQVRAHVLKRLRDESLTNGLREYAANTMLGLLLDGCLPRLRLRAALALAEFTDVDGVPAGLGAVMRDTEVPLDIRYAAFTALEQAGPTPECVALLRQLLLDDALGPSARRLLLSWQVEELK